MILALKRLGVHEENAVSRTTNKTAPDPLRMEVRNKPLSALTDEALRRYFTSLNGEKPADLYQFVMGEVEKPLFRTVLDYTGGNQSDAAKILGINRGTLRKKLKIHKLKVR